MINRILFLLCLFNLISCKPMWGTDHGNPEALPSPTDSGAIISVIQSLKETACTRVHACFSNISKTDCQLAIAANEQVPIELNLGSYRNMTDIDEAEKTDILQPKSDQVSLCQSAINNASCSSTAIFDSGLNSQDLTNLHFIFRADPSCRSLYE